MNHFSSSYILYYSGVQCYILRYNRNYSIFLARALEVAD